jgi:AmmeMemoRadiSam system protein A/AmmeMemoRadiSam system protein B
MGMSIAAAFAVPHPPLIIPTVGRGEERKIQATIDAYRSIAKKISDIMPHTIIFVSPHSIMYSDYIHISPGMKAKGDFGSFGASREKLEVEYDSELIHRIEKKASERNISAGTTGEKDRNLDHGTMVPLHFITEGYQGFKSVRIGISGLSPLEHYNFGMCIRDAVEELGTKAVVVASGDLSHRLKEDGPYGFMKEGPVFDELATRAFATGDFMKLLDIDEHLCDNAGECGLRSFQIMAGALDGMKLESKLLSYEGPFGVGYAVASFIVNGTDQSRRYGEIFEENEKKRLEGKKAGEDEFVRLARLSLETFLRTGKRLKMPQGLPPELTARRAGVFVSLKKHGRLRGCIGTIEGVTGSIAEEIIRNAVSAGVEDPRFDRVSENELSEIVYSVDVLGDAEDVESVSELDEKRYGVIVSKGLRRGLLLPNLEGVNSPLQQIDIALQKGGISKSETYKIQRFEVVRHT